MGYDAIDVPLELGKVSHAIIPEMFSGVADGEIEFGALAMREDGEAESYEQFDGSDDQTIAGFAVFTNSGNIDDLKFEDEDLFRVLRKGIIWTQVSDSDAAGSATVEPGDPLVVDENGFVIDKDEAEVTTDGTDNAVEILNGEVLTEADPGEKVAVELQLPSDVNYIDLSSDES